MIIANLEQKKAQLEKVFSWLELAFDKDLIQETKGMIALYEKEQSATTKHTINLEYGNGCKVSRIKNPNKPKQFFPKQLNDNNQWENKITDIKKWFPYRFGDLAKARGKIVVIHEGEKATDYCRSLGLVSFCFLGAKANNDEFIKQQLEILKNFDILGFIYVSDFDKAGEEKAEKIKLQAINLDIPFLICPINLIFPEAKQHDDFADFVIANKDQSSRMVKGMFESTIEDNLDLLIEHSLANTQKVSLAEVKEEIERLLISELEDFEINLQIENLRQRVEPPISEYSWNRNYVNPLRQKHKKERAKLDIQAYLQTDDPFDKVSLQQKIQQNYGYSKEQFQFLVKAVETLNCTPVQEIFTIEELLADDTEQNWLIPSLLPVGESLLITAAPKTGKSILASEIMRAIVTGGNFLGEKIKKGKVLYCYSDEGKFSFKSRLRLMGFDLPEIINDSNKDNLKAFGNFDLFNLSNFEKHIDTYRPDLIVLDSLRSISSSVGLSENDNLFVQHLYNVKKLLDKYSVTTIFIHHDNKAGETSGNLGIEGTVWGVAQLLNQQGAIVNDDTEAEGVDFDTVWSEDYRILHLKRARSAEAQKWKLFLNNPYEWTEKGIYEFLGDADDPTGKNQKAIDLISDYLKGNSNTYFEVEEIERELLLPRPTIYRSLQKLERSQKIRKKRSIHNRKKWAFQWALNNNNSQQGLLSHSELQKSEKIESLTTPPPLNRDNLENEKPETIDTNSDSLIITVDYHDSHDNQNDNYNNSRDNLENNEFSSDSDSNYHATPVAEGGGLCDNPKNTDSDNLETSKMPYCKKLLIESDFIGLKVRHENTPEIEGEIIEISKMGANYLATVLWFENNQKIKETCWLTLLISDEIDFKAWREAKINEG